ncbi:MAG: 3-methyl-2-oxobutanoate hydroxymethyltransferase [Methylophilus sp.]|nr:3-methyl-2-oxobutanoate hydroxymethyltransferase [Methylophilus sp.]
MHLTDLAKKVQSGEKLAMLTCYDATYAKLMEAEGVDILLVGDSLGMVIQGDSNTLSVTMQDMLYHTRIVAKGAKRTVIMADMPYGSYEHDLQVALTNAQALLESGAHIVKIEGGGHMVETARYLVTHGVPVCAHLGFTPQSVEQLGGYKIQGKTVDAAHTIMLDAHAMSDAGVSFVLMEMVPATLAADITSQIAVPTIGIGAGVECSGQVLVLQDLMGIYSGPADKDPQAFKAPRFVRNFLTETGSVQGAVRAYVHEVKNKTFPAKQHSY